MSISSLIRYVALILLTLPMFGNTATIAAGGAHTCALTTAGGVQCWGHNWNGQLGDGTTAGNMLPTAVNGLDGGVQAITVEANRSCALTMAGGVQCWGNNSFGALGDGTETDRWVPVAVSGLSGGVQAITAGYYHACALTTAGAVQCWGSNQNGQLGNGATVYSSTPVAVSGLSGGVQAIAAGYYHTCALMTAGGVQCWGFNGNGQLGDGTTTQRLSPVVVSGLSGGVVAIVAGGAHSCAINGEGDAQCWGNNYYGQLGDGTQTDRWEPVSVSGLGSGTQAIAADDSHTCALTAVSGVKCWGDNLYGQLGDSTNTTRLTPGSVSGLSDGVQAIAVGARHSCAQQSEGGVKCWGDNYNGQLGDGTQTNRWEPVAVRKIQAISVTTTAPAISIVGASFSVIAASNSGLLVAITASGGCSISGATVTMISETPFCTVTYTQAGNAEYAAAPVIFTITSVDTDNDGIGNNADIDDDGDNVPDYIDADYLNAAVNSERLMQLNGGYQGSSINESALTNQ